MRDHGATSGTQILHREVGVMKVIIEGPPEEIAALVVATQGRQEKTTDTAQEMIRKIVEQMREVGPCVLFA